MAANIRLSSRVPLLIKCTAPGSTFAFPDVDRTVPLHLRLRLRLTAVFPGPPPFRKTENTLTNRPTPQAGTRRSRRREKSDDTSVSSEASEGIFYRLPRRVV